MAKNRQQRRARNAANAARTSDSFQNLIARVGYGTANQASAGRYGFSPISRDRTMLEWAYRSSWIAGKAVDAFADDMTREGVDVNCDLPPDQLEELQKEAERLEIWDKLNDTIKWARLYGGALAVMLIDGQDTATPLRPETVTKGQFKGLLVLDRWMVEPSLQDLITEYGPDFGKPKYYRTVADTISGIPNMNIHHSRVVRIDGVELPHWQKMQENGWGQSVLERLWDRLLAFDSSTEGAAQLVYKAHLRTYKVEGLRQIIAAGGKAFDGLVAQIDAVRAFQSNEGLTLMDVNDEFEAHSYSFSGLSDMLLQFGQQLSGAMDIPLVRLFGQSPAGLNATGESDLRNYYDSIKQNQERRLRTPVGKIYDIMFRSLFGQEPPENMSIVFNPLWQMDDEQKANVANTVATAVGNMFEAGIIDRNTALQELRESSEATGIFSKITDEQIEEAEDEPPPSMSELEPPQEQEGSENETTPASAAS